MNGDPLQFLWDRLDPILKSIGLDKTRTLALIVLLATVMHAKGWLPEQVIGWLDQYANYIATTVGATGLYFLRLGVQKGEIPEDARR